MKIKIFETKKEMGKVAAERAVEVLEEAIKEKGEAVFVAATGASQFEFLKALTSMPSIDWSRTTMFHLDEYVGLWVAIEEEKVLSSGKNIKEVYEEAKKKCPKKRILLTRVPNKDTMIF